ncbi:MAG: PD-(D/E)XK nuclease family protein [Synergistaceae bacterium]|jgi:CRISPR/Cas system-associated exonuclease Cas4 (RecB family)|nr:PD-(D/E)XK nuclease family protein [Synergistaceae bacterium]
MWPVVNGEIVAFGKTFHNEIAGPFHKNIAESFFTRRTEFLSIFKDVTEIGVLQERLRNFVAEYYLVPFLKNNGSNLKIANIEALNRAIEKWIEHLSGYLWRIPSLWQAPRELVDSVLKNIFHKPEQTLSALHVFSDGVMLKLSGRYDCALFNPDTKEPMLIEFKGYGSDDNAVSGLAQMLVYAWLFEKNAGFVPSLTVFYLVSNEAPEVIPSHMVADMLKNNFPSALDLMRRVLERRRPIPRSDYTWLCSKCYFNARCDSDWG